MHLTCGAPGKLSAAFRALVWVKAAGKLEGGRNGTKVAPASKTSGRSSERLPVGSLAGEGGVGWLGNSCPVTESSRRLCREVRKKEAVGIRK